MTEQEVLERLQASGHDMPPSRFARWREKGLVPVTGSRSGRGQAKGRAAHDYPEIAVEQTLRIIELRTERLNLDEIGWRLWLEGYEVNRSLWFDTFKFMAYQFDKWASDIREDRNSDVGETWIDQFVLATLKAKNSNRLIRQIKKALGPDRYAAVMNDVASMATGTFQALCDQYIDTKEHDGALRALDITLGLTHAKTDTVDNIGPITTGDYSNILQGTFEPLRDIKLGEFLETVTPSDLRKVACSLIGLLNSIEVASSIFEQAYAKNAFGLSRAAMFAKLDRHTFAGMALVWLLVQIKSREKFHDLDKMAQLFLAASISVKKFLEESHFDLKIGRPVFRRKTPRKKST